VKGGNWGRKDKSSQEKQGVQFESLGGEKERKERGELSRWSPSRAAGAACGRMGGLKVKKKKKNKKRKAGEEESESCAKGRRH